MEVKKIVLNEERGVTLTAMLQSSGGEYGDIMRPAVLILPGGGYFMCSDREAEPVAFEYLNAGYQAFILRYSVVPHAVWDKPLLDYEEAITLIRQHAKEWNICENRVAVIGFSAGGHLALCAATMAKNRPNAVIAGYPAVIREMCDMCQPNLPAPNEEVDDKTCPCFLFAARDDNVVPIKNMIAMQQALAEHEVSFEAHVYSYGGHGFSVAQPYLLDCKHTDRLKNWVHDSIDWLGEVWGEFHKIGYTAPAFGRAVNGNKEETFSAGCTLNYLLAQSDKVGEIIKKELTFVAGTLSKFPPAVQKNLGDLFRLYDILPLCGYTEDQISSVDQKLRTVKNI